MDDDFAKQVYYANIMNYYSLKFYFFWIMPMFDTNTPTSKNK